MNSSPSRTGRPKCWCSNSTPSDFSKSYWWCSNCGTLFRNHPQEHSDGRVIDDSRDFYGRNYWFDYQSQQFGNPDIVQRAALDLPERCVHWLKHLLDWKLPPAHVLEIGCGHGGSVALMKWAGFSARGLELSHWLVNWSRDTFDIPVLQGPLEDQDLANGSLDVIAMFDVLEHLSNPVDTLTNCIELLKPDGILLIQTPVVPEGKNHLDMRREIPRLSEILADEGHLYLFSRRAITSLLKGVGFTKIRFLEPLFSCDMFLVASRTELQRNTAESISESLCSQPAGRLIEAILTLSRDATELRTHLGALQNNTILYRFFAEFKWFSREIYKRYKRLRSGSNRKP